VASLKIPERYRDGLTKIASLPDVVFEGFFAALKGCPPSYVKTADVTAYVAKAAPGVTASDAKKMVSAVLSLQSVRLDAEVPVQRVVSDVGEAMQSASGGKLPASEQEKLKERLLRILSVSSLDSAAKALALRVDFGNVFCDAKILTDLRPIFAKPEEAPVGTIITHTLKLVYHEHGDHKELYVALDSNDIIALKKVLERAESKEKSLTPLIERVKVSEVIQ
jgi:hypothetical protein